MHRRKHTSIICTCISLSHRTVSTLARSSTSSRWLCRLLKALARGLSACSGISRVNRSLLAHLELSRSTVSTLWISPFTHSTAFAFTEDAIFPFPAAGEHTRACGACGAFAAMHRRPSPRTLPRALLAASLKASEFSLVQPVQKASVGTVCALLATRCCQFPALTSSPRFCGTSSEPIAL